MALREGNALSSRGGALLAGAAVAALFVVGCVTGRAQPRMQAALDDLRAARASLASAATDKRGHRVRAMELVDRAIDEVQAGIAYAAGR